MRFFDPSIDVRYEIFCQFFVVTFNVKFKVQTEATLIPVRGSEQYPFVVDEHEFGMIERIGRKPHVAAILQQRVQLAHGCPADEREIIYARHDDIDLNSAKSSKTQTGNHF